MARVADSFYFENFAAAAENNCRAARMLEQVMREYDPDGLEASIEQMHEIEQANDELRHELLDTVLTAFITPIEREGIVALSGRLDDVTDCIEGRAAPAVLQQRARGHGGCARDGDAARARVR